MNKKGQFNITKDKFGTTSHGHAVFRYTISNGTGLEMSVLNYGGIITSLMMPDKNHSYKNIVLGFDSFEGYLENKFYFGAIIGRYANRIADGQFSLDGKIYNLDINDGNNHLHGGNVGFDKVLWDVEQILGVNFATLKLHYLDVDGQGGYPGNLKTTVTYTLSSDHLLDIEYKAVTDKRTVINFTQHSYFNLSGNFDSKIIDHIVIIDANHFLPVDENLIPTSEIRHVNDTPFDFTKSKAIEDGLENETRNKQLKWDPGFNHCWILNNYHSGYDFAASAFHPETGRLMEVYTDLPGLQFYIGNFLEKTLPEDEDSGFNRRTGFCMETQYFPNSPNEPKFPSVVLDPDKEFYSKTSFQFLVR